MTAEPFLQLRWLLWTLGAALLAHIVITYARKRRPPSLPSPNANARRASAAIFFILAALAKWTQLKAGGMNAQDFWLFEDMLRHMAQGGFFLTRFAPQSVQVIQHGIVHPMLSFALLAPFAKILGATATAILFEPAVFALAALSLGRLAAKRWGEGPALWLALSFLLSTQVGRIMMYDVHPEAAYPLAVFLWAEAITSKKPHAWLVAAASCFLAGIKEDAVLVLPPLVAAMAVRPPGSRPPLKLLFLSLFVAVFTAAAQMGLVHHWKTIVEIVPQGALPRTSSGKPQRRKAKQMFIDGTFARARESKDESASPAAGA